MDGHGNTCANVERVKDCHGAQPPFLWKQNEHCGRHGKSNGCVGGRPAPENPVSQKAKSKDMACVVGDAMGKGVAARDGLITGRNKSPNERSLADGPGHANGRGMFQDDANQKKKQRQHHRNSLADDDRRKHPRPQFRISCAPKVFPIKPRSNENKSKNDRNQVVKNIPAFKATNDIARNAG